MEYLLKVSTIIIVFYLVYKVFLQRDTFYESNRSFLLLGLITSFIIPLLVIPIYIEHTPVLVSNYSFSDVPVVENVEEPFNILDYLPTIYLIGVLFFSIRFTIQLVSLFNLILKNKSEKQGVYTFIRVNVNIAPFSFFNWIVYNPNQFNETELDQIITHEKVHVRQYHSVDILLTQLTCIVLWFNPLMWLYNKDLKQNLEFLADNSAINNTKSKKDYQYTLLKTSLPTLQLTLSNNFYNSLIKKRIIMLHKSKSKKVNQLKFVIVIPLLAIFLMSFNTEEVYIAKTKPSNETVEAVKEKNIEFKSTPKAESREIKKGNVITKTANNIEMLLITKDFTNTDFDNLISKLQKKGITIKFKGIERNDDGEITAIKINVNSKNTSANYSINSDDVIKPIKISFDDDGKSISIGNAHTKHKHKDSDHAFKFKSKNGNHKIHSSEKGHRVIVFSDNDDDIDKHIDEDVEVIIEKDNDEQHEEDIMILKSSGNGKTYSKEKSSKILFSFDGDTTPLYIIDGKEAGKKDFDKLNPDSIESINVLKGKKANKKYGDKGENGVLIISTKKKKNAKIAIKGFINDGPPLYIINGKEVKKEDFEKLSPDDIESINVIKDVSKNKKYGDKGKNGVVEITTKKE